MSEFKLQHIVNKLLQHLGGNVRPEELVDFLQKNINSSTHSDYSGAQASEESDIQHILAKISNPEAFLAKFNDLKEKNVDSLNSYIHLLSKISQSSGVKNMLLKSKKQQPSLPQKGKLTKDNLPLVKNILKEKVRNSSVSQLNSVLNVSSSVPLSSTPSVSSWVQRKPNMSYDFPTKSFGHYTATVHEVSQENMLIDDLLNVLIGLPGCYIEPEDLKDTYSPRTFKINDNISMTLQELVKQILPLASHYSVMQRFTEEKMRFEFGQVNNALAEAMEELLKDHTLFIVQLESEFRSGNLNLQKMWFYTQRNMQCLEVAANIAFLISKSGAIGGKVLSLLHDHVISSIGDDRTQQLCLKLMEAACVPYMKMLGMWIYTGIICDPINEFLVEDNEIAQLEDMPMDYSADYWDRKYWVRKERIPKFLDPVTDMILKAGKYINVIRQCGRPVKNKLQTIQYQIEEKHYIEAIEKAYIFASQTLLDLVVKEKDLIGRLKSVKHYFLLDQGDFIVTFLALCEKELNKAVADVVQGRLESLMDLALRLSSAVNDPYKDDLRTELLPFNLQFQMFKILSIQTTAEQQYWTTFDPQMLSVIESFTFSYEVRWPLSLILNKKSLACYQMIFRYLFYAKHVERMICQVWKSNKVAKKFHCDDAKHYREAFALRHKMLHCIQNLEYHMMVEVIEPHWCTLLQKIAKVHNVDEILTCHCDFLDCCLKDCMLTIPAILSTIVGLLGICVDFCKFMQGQAALFAGNQEGELNLSFKDNISSFDLRFSKAVKTLLAQINDLNRDTSEHDRLFNLLYSLGSFSNTPL